jgi:hypothetical protein
MSQSSLHDQFANAGLPKLQDFDSVGDFVGWSTNLCFKGRRLYAQRTGLERLVFHQATGLDR